MSRKLLLLAGSNFVGTPAELHGCLHDLDYVRAMAEAQGFTTLLDLRGPAMTAAAWRGALAWLIAEAAPGDLILHAHSHHGAQVPDDSEPDGLEECWCPDDFDWSPERMITGHEMGELLSHLPAGATWVDWADCCHAADSLRAAPARPLAASKRLTRRAGMRSARRGLVARMARHVHERGTQGGTIIQLAACGEQETAADTVIDGRPCGAFTHALLRQWEIATHIRLYDYAAAILGAATGLTHDGYVQHPELDCTPGAERLPFLAASPAVGVQPQ